MGKGQYVYTLANHDRNESIIFRTDYEFIDSLTDCFYDYHAYYEFMNDLGWCDDDAIYLYPLLDK